MTAEIQLEVGDVSNGDLGRLVAGSFTRALNIQQYLNGANFEFTSTRRSFWMNLLKTGARRWRLL